MREKNQIIKEAREALKMIYEKGIYIQSLLRKRYNSLTYSTKSGYRYIDGLLLPLNYADAKLLIAPEIFSTLFIEKFWQLFKIIQGNLENPLIQPWVRLIIEYTCDIIWYFKQQEFKKKEVACKFWLCTLGLIGGRLKHLNYDEFLNFLEKEKNKLHFSNLKREGYPPSKFHKEWHNLFPAISKENLPNFIEDYLKNLKDISIKREAIEDFYKWFSIYHHPNILVVTNLEKEIKDKSHIFRCFIIISCCGVSLIEFLSNKILGNPELVFSSEEKQKIARVTKETYEILRN